MLTFVTKCFVGTVVVLMTFALLILAIPAAIVSMF